MAPRGSQRHCLSTHVWKVRSQICTQTTAQHHHSTLLPIPHRTLGYECDGQDFRRLWSNFWTPSYRGWFPTQIRKWHGRLIKQSGLVLLHVEWARGVKPHTCIDTENSTAPLECFVGSLKPRRPFNMQVNQTRFSSDPGLRRKLEHSTPTSATSARNIRRFRSGVPRQRSTCTPVARDI